MTEMLYKLQRLEPDGWRDEPSRFSQVAMAGLHAQVVTKLDGKPRRVFQQAIASFGQSDWREVPGDIVVRHLSHYMQMKFWVAGPRVEA